MEKKWLKDGKFIELSGDQIKGLSDEQLAAYTAEKSTAAIEAKSEAIKAEVLAETQKALEEANKGKITKDELNKELAKISEKINKTFDENVIEELKTSIEGLNDVIKEQGISLSKLGEDGKPSTSKNKGVGDILYGIFKENDYLEEYTDPDTGMKSERMKDEFVKRNLGSHTVKTAIEMTIPLTQLPGSTPGTSIGYMTGYDPQAVLLGLTKDTHVTQVIPSGITTKSYYGIVVFYSETDGSDTAAENAALGKSSILMKTQEFKLHDIGAYYHVSKNELADFPEVANEINRVTPDRIMSAFDGKFFGTNTTDANDVQGILGSGNYTAFTPATYNGTVQGANKIDVISRMKLQAEIANEDVNIVWVHPSIYTEIAETKDLNNNNIADRRLSFDNMGQLIAVCGLAIFKNKELATNKAVVMWNEACKVGIRQEIEFEMGIENDDITNRMRTIAIVARMTNGIRKAAAIIYCDDLDAAEGVIDIT